MKLSVIIVNYNVKYFLEQCLHSVLRAIDGIAAEVLVIDNASTDSSLEYLLPLFPSVTFIAGKENLGFGKANNVALKQARGEYVLFLNPDTIVPENCFAKCIHFLDSNSSAGALGVRMLDGTGIFLPESKRSFPTTATAFFKATGLSSLFPKSTFFNKYSLGFLDDKSNHKVDVLAGAFIMARKDLLNKVGGFDEQFFMYGEDIDLSYRLKQAGYDNWYFAGTSIIHFKGESLQKWSANHVKVFYEAMIVFVKKHYKGTGAGMLRLLLLLGIRSKSFVSLLKGYTPEINARSQANLRTIVIGNDKDLEECKVILASSSPQNNVVGNFQFHSADDIDKLESFCIENKIQQIIFCDSSITYESIISIIDQLNKKYSYRFHASQSRSIVGSSSKSNPGEALFMR